MPTGVVKYYNDTKSYGFITDDTGKDIFVHVTGLVDKVTTGDRVSYDVTEGRKGPNAVNVKKMA